MKKTLPYIFSLIFLCSFVSSANNKLIELNREWLNQTDINVREITNVPDDEVGKIQMHLRLVEQTLRNRSTEHLSKAQLINRLNCLDILHNYWTAGVFPQNEDYNYRTPIFIDKYHTFCAVGHLMKETGAEDVARAINKENNLIYVREISNTAATNWINSSGLTMEECAWIQPGYSFAYELDLSGLSPTNPIMNRAIFNSFTTFSATMTSSGSPANATTDNMGNVLFQLGTGTEQCINLTFNGPYYFLELRSVQNVIGGTLDSNDSLRVNSQLTYPNALIGEFVTNYTAPYTGLSPLSTPSSTITWIARFDALLPTTPITVCASQSSISGTSNMDLPILISAIVPSISVPISLNKFSVRKVQQSNELNWSTPSEHNNDYFTIEKSVDGSIWESIGHVWSKGNSSTETSYSYIDLAPIVGKNWYRIKSTDLNKQESYSEIRSILFGDKAGIKVLTANPVLNEIIVQIDDTELLDDAAVVNLTGQRMSVEKLINNQEVKFDVSNLAAGIYFIQSKNLNYKFVKK